MLKDAIPGIIFLVVIGLFPVIVKLGVAAIHRSDERKRSETPKGF